MPRTPVYAVSWSDGENPESNDGCGFLIAPIVVATTFLIALFFRVRGRS